MLGRTRIEGIDTDDLVVGARSEELAAGGETDGMYGP